MIHRTVITVLVFLVFCAAGHAAEPAGLLSMVSGTVQIVRMGETRPARIADLILPGDRIVTSRQSEASFLFCPESRAAKILAEGEVQFDAAAVRILKGKLADDRKVPSCRLPGNLSLASASQLQSGVLRLRGSNLILLSPSRTNIASLQPHFRWEPLDGATEYELKITDREERTLWRQKLTSRDAPYPTSAPALAWDQKYLWHVTARNGDEVLTDVGSFFQILPKERADDVRSTEEAARRSMAADPKDNNLLFLLAFLYEENGMLDEAARTYHEITQRTGTGDWVQVRLVDLMNKLGWDKVESARP